MVKTVLYVLGVVLVLVGLLGFVNDPVLGVFEVDVLHNIIHLVTGVVLVVAASMGGGTGALLVKILAVVYAVVAVLGLVLPGDTLLGLYESNLADDLLHVVLAVILIWLGWFAEKRSVGSAPRASAPMDSTSAGPAQGPQV